MEEVDDSIDNVRNAGTPFIVDDNDEDAVGDDANLLHLGDDAVGSITSANRQEENHLVVLHKQQKICSAKWIVTYAVVFLVILITLAGTALLYFLPEASKYSPSIHWGMMLLPIQPSSILLSHLTVSTIYDEDCITQQYKIYLLPHGRVPNVSHDTNYSKGLEEHGYQNYIYCLENSTFYFELDADEDVCLCLYIGDTKSTCEDEVGVSRCVHLNQTNKSANISVWATGYNGSFYSWRYWPNSANVGYHVDRYYYNSSLYGISYSLVTTMKSK